jgi:hypothetical protein
LLWSMSMFLLMRPQTDNTQTDNTQTGSSQTGGSQTTSAKLRK